MLTNYIWNTVPGCGGFLMGRQINYYMWYDDFRKVARKALELGCLILKNENGRITKSGSIDIVTPDENRYYLYIPEAGPLDIQLRNGRECVGGYHSSGKVVIEAGYSVINHEKQKISRARLFSITGYRVGQGNQSDRPDCVKKIYDRLAREIKKIAPYTEIIDTIISVNDEDYMRKKAWKHKEYITPELLTLKMESGYKL